jgi:hypothetical protein
LHCPFQSQRRYQLFAAIQQWTIASETQSHIRTLPKSAFECQNRQEVRLLFDKTTHRKEVRWVAAGIGGGKTQDIDPARVEVNLFPKCAKPDHLLAHRLGDNDKGGGTQKHLLVIFFVPLESPTLIGIVSVEVND